VEIGIVHRRFSASSDITVLPEIGHRVSVTAPFVCLGSAFGVSRDLMERHPWESVQRHLRNTKMQELYGGFVYIISGEAF
jgi:hypothetical protein